MIQTTIDDFKIKLSDFYKIYPAADTDHFHIVETDNTKAALLESVATALVKYFNMSATFTPNEIKKIHDISFYVTRDMTNPFQANGLTLSLSYRTSYDIRHELIVSLDSEKNILTYENSDIEMVFSGKDGDEEDCHILNISRFVQDVDKDIAKELLSIFDTPERIQQAEDLSVRIKEQKTYKELQKTDPEKAFLLDFNKTFQSTGDSLFSLNKATADLNITSPFNRVSWKVKNGKLSVLDGIHLDIKQKEKETVCCFSRNVLLEIPFPKELHTAFQKNGEYVLVNLKENENLQVKEILNSYPETETNIYHYFSLTHIEDDVTELKCTLEDKYKMPILEELICHSSDVSSLNKNNEDLETILENTALYYEEYKNTPTLWFSTDEVPKDLREKYHLIGDINIDLKENDMNILSYAYHKTITKEEEEIER